MIGRKIDGQNDRWVERQMDLQINRQNDRQQRINRWIEQNIEVTMDRKIDSDGRMDGWKWLDDRMKNGLTDRNIDGQSKKSDRMNDR